MSQGGHSEPILLLALFYQSTPSCLKVVGGVCAGGHVVMCRRPCGGVGGPCDYCVSPSPFGLDFGTLDLGTSDLGLTISRLSNAALLSWVRVVCLGRGVGVRGLGQGG